MERLIELKDQDYQYCLDYVSGKTNIMALNNINRIIKAISDGTSIPKGHWIYTDECHEHGKCSKCGHGEIDLVDGKSHNYCPNCGCRMNSEVEQ